MTNYYIPISILLGWVAGIVVNYLSDTLPRTRSLSRPSCIYCNHNFRFSNYLLWPRRCTSCEHKRPPRAWIVETLFIVISVWLWITPTIPLIYPISLLIFIYFGVVVIIDIEHRVILHQVSIFGAVLFSIIGFWLHGPLNTLLGGLVGYLSMLLLYYFGHIVVRFISRLRQQRIEEDALGFGDVNLCGVIGLLLGWPGIFAGIIVTILIGGAVSFFYIIIKIATKQYQPELALPYGPFLVAAAIYLLYFQNLPV